MEREIKQVAKTLSRITYVEDEPDIRAVAELALKTIGGFEVDVCTSGQEAITKTPDFSPDLILLDVMMPVLDGIETYRQLREKTSLKDKPVIFMTAKVQPHEVQGYKDLGAIDVIPKPFDPMTLSEEIQTIWQQHISKEPV